MQIQQSSFYVHSLGVIRSEQDPILAATDKRTELQLLESPKLSVAAFAYPSYYALG